MYLFIEKGLRGGIYYIAKRYSEASNKCIKSYDPTKPSKQITYLDMNNFYGWAMSGYLPYGGFRWLEYVDNSNVNSVSKKSSIGYIHQHPYIFDGYQLAPQKLAIPYDMLSAYSKKTED